MAGGFLYWNVRKTAFVRRGRQGRNPCQNPSDDNIARRVRCDAVAHWHEPARFGRVCPLLVQTPQGWCCSVNARGVRPFWGSALAWWGGGLLATYVAGTLLVFAVLAFFTGARVSWWQVAWPGRWSEIRQEQAGYLYDHAMRAFVQGSLNEAHLALASAAQRDPSNQDAAVLLGQITMFQGSFLHADALFERLMRERESEATRIAITYHDTLLSLGRTDRLAQHCLAMATRDSAHAAVWVRSLLLALRNDSVTASELATAQRGQLAAIAPHARLLVQAEIELQAGNRQEGIALLRKPFSGPYNLLYMQLQVERLAELGAHTDAQTLLDFYGPIMGSVPHAIAQFALSRQMQDDLAARMLFRRVLSGPFDEKRVEQLAVALIKAPDPVLYAELSDKVLATPGLAASMATTLWVTGLVCADRARADIWKEHDPDFPPASFPRVRQIEFASRDLQDPQSVVHLINVVAFPREVITALLTRVDRAAPSKRTLRLNVE